MQKQFHIFNNDNLKVLRKLKSNSVDAIVTDPPYGLSFMGKKWDYDVPSVELWSECLRVLKEGGHLLSFAGSRTQHRMAVNIEDAGFEVRDMLAWVYGSGFPKSHNISKAIDRMQGNERAPTGETKTHSIKGVIVAEERTAIGAGAFGQEVVENVTKSISEDGMKWEGWGTALKPAIEPLTLARKPFKGSVTANVLKHGTGGLNVASCRIGEDARWPANFMHDGSDEVLDMLPPNAHRFFYVPQCSPKDRNEGVDKNNHPTVKPTDLMSYLCRLVTPIGGIVLDPFAGSGSTGKAAVREGFKFIGMELDSDYCEIAKARIQHELTRDELG